MCKGRLLTDGDFKGSHLTIIFLITVMGASAPHMPIEFGTLVGQGKMNFPSEMPIDQKSIKFSFLNSDLTKKTIKTIKNKKEATQIK